MTRQSPRWTALLPTLLLAGTGALRAEEGKKTFGSAFLDSYFPPGEEVRDAVKLRYRCKVAVNECDGPEKWKIVFMFHFLHSAPGAKTYELQSNLYTWRFAYSHGARRMTSGEVGGLRHFAGESGLFLSVPDNHQDRRVGARSLAPAMFPTLDQEIDGIRDLWKREQVSQINVTGKVIAVELASGEMVPDLQGWNVHGALPEGKYRVWTMTAAWDGGTHRVEFALPEEGARHFAPGRMTQIATEAFRVHPGTFRVQYWDFEYQRENREEWEALRKWKLSETDAKAGENTWGMKRAEMEGRVGIEVSNDGTPTYARKGEVLELK